MRFLIVVLSLLVILGCALAADVQVNSTLSEAIARAQDGDVIVIPSGNYTGDDNKNLTLYGRSLSFRSASGNYNDVIIDCEGNGTVVLVHYKRTPVNYTGPELPPGNATSSLYFYGVTFANCVGAFYLNVTNTTGNNSVSIESCQFVNHTARYGRGRNNRKNGGAIYAEDEILVNITSSVFTNCTADDYGGAIYVEYYTNLTITNSTFLYNYANTGGAISVQEADLTVDSSVFQYNMAGAMGAAVYLYLDTTGWFTTSRFSYNRAPTGGAVYVTLADASLDTCVFDHNRATDAAAVYSYGNALVILTNCAFTNNTAVRLGGALAATDGSIIVKSGSIINNAANDGGAVAIIGGKVTLTNVTISGNTASLGGAFYIMSYGTITVISSSLSDNYASSSADTLYCIGSTLTFQDTTITTPNKREDEQNGVDCKTVPGDNTWCTVIATGSGDWSDVCIDPPATVIDKSLAGWKIALIVIGSVVGALLIGFIVAYAISSKFEAPSFFQQLGNNGRDRGDTV